MGAERSLAPREYALFDAIVCLSEAKARAEQALVNSAAEVKRLERERNDALAHGLKQAGIANRLLRLCNERHADRCRAAKREIVEDPEALKIVAGMDAHG